MDTRLNPHPERDQAQPGTIPVRLLVWGVTNADQEHAIYRASLGQSRAAWQVVSTERQSGSKCQIDMHDPKTIATGSGYHWAYAVYPAGATS